MGSDDGAGVVVPPADDDEQAAAFAEAERRFKIVFGSSAVARQSKLGPNGLREEIEEFVKAFNVAGDLVTDQMKKQITLCRDLIDETEGIGPPPWRGKPGWSPEALVAHEAFVVKKEHQTNKQVVGNFAPGTIFWSKTATRYNFSRAEKYVRARSRERADEVGEGAPTARLLHKSELLELLKLEGPLTPEDDQWAACINPDRVDARDFICCGDYHSSLGKVHCDTYGWPDWADDPDRVFDVGKGRKLQGVWNKLVVWTFDTPDGGNAASESSDDEDDTRRTVVPTEGAGEAETLDKLKAKTMFNMLEEPEIEGLRKKLLFLTNAQADLIVRSRRTDNQEYTIKLLFDLFQASVDEPQLVINLLRSRGTIADILGKCEDGARAVGEYIDNGIVRGEHPWATEEEALRCEKRLDQFMSEVVIPIAAQNNAVVITDCLKGGCFLSSSFNRVMALQASRYAGKPPITVISFSCDLEILYRNPDKKAEWRAIRDKSAAWRRREGPQEDPQRKGINRLIADMPHYMKYGKADIDPGVLSSLDPTYYLLLTTYYLLLTTYYLLPGCALYSRSLSLWVFSPACIPPNSS